ncbi:hypothetical protein KZY98_15770, partial [Croceibacter atlanticus]
SVLTTAGSDPETVLVTAGDTTATTDDGYNVPVNTGTLSGVVFNDENNNGIQDAGELGLPGVDVVITDMDGNIQTVMTDANG